MATDPVAGSNVGKTIGQLTEATNPQLGFIQSFFIPVEYDGQNYRITPGQIAALITKDSLGLGNVDNTSDANKPLSLAVSTALAGYWTKQDTIPMASVGDLADALLSKRSKTESIPLADVDGLATVLNAKMDRGEFIPISQVSSLQDALDSKAASNHTHTLASLSDWNLFNTNLQTALSQRTTEDRVAEMISQLGTGTTVTQVNQLISTALQPYATTASVNTAIGQALNGMATQLWVQQLVDTATNGLVTQSSLTQQLNNAVENLTTVSDVQQMIAGATTDFQTATEVNTLISSALQALPENSQMLVMNDADSDWI